MNAWGRMGIACGVMFVWMAGGSSGWCATRHVVLLYDERPELPGLAMIDAGIRLGLAGAPERVEIYCETMDNSRFDSPANATLLRDYLRAKYAGKRIDAAVAVMEPALEFLLNHRGVLFPESPDVPIVFCGIDRRTFGDRSLPTGVTGVLLKRAFAPTLELALRIHPDTQRIVVVGGCSDFDTKLIEQAREEFRPFEDRLAFTYSTTQPMGALMSDLSRLPPRTLVLYTTIFRDAAGEAFTPHEAAEKISVAANAPTYGFVDQYVGRGIVGGRLYGLAAHGETVGGLVSKVLAGTPVKELPPIEPENTEAMFDWRQLQRWHISENSLPAGSTILFREPTIWQRYKWRITGIVAICLGQSLLILLLLKSLRKRRVAEAELRESEQRMTLAADAARLGMWVWETSNLRMWASQKWRSIYGYSPDQEISFNSLIVRVHPEDRAGVERTIANACKEKNTFDVRHRLLLPNGTIRWISSSGRVETPGNNGSLRLLGISIDITERKEAEDAAREVSGKLITAQEDERRRIARELHDDLNQRLALLSVEADLLGQIDHDPAAQPLISDIASQVKDLSSEVHKLSYQLHPAKLEQLGLVFAIRSFCQEIGRHGGIPVELVHNAIPRKVNRNVALCLYRITQEALQNVVKHSHATTARVELAGVNGELRLIISDNGLGCDLRRASHHAGLGLVGMRERVRLVAGQIQFHSTPGQGTRIEVTVPKTKNEPSGNGAAREA